MLCSLKKLPSTIFLYFFTSLMISLYSVNAMAMGKMGHQLVCQLAVDNLTQNEQIKLAQHLKAIPLSHRKIINKYLHRKPEAEVLYAHACTWADAIKTQNSFKKYKTWHYLNVSRKAQSIVEASCEKDCITQAIPFHHTQFLSSHNPWDKTQTLLFLGHWYADIHQPFHISFKSDLGGNKTKTQLVSTSKMARKCDNLHWIWDECLLYLPHQKNRMQIWQENYSALQILWKNTPQAQHKAWQSSPTWEMANESFLLVKQASIHYCKIQKEFCASLGKQEIKLPITYQDTHYPMLQKRLLQAAIRLNNQLRLLLHTN